MIYPRFLREQDTVGITAPSAPIVPEKRAAYRLSVSNLQKDGLNIIETPHVHSDAEALVSAAGSVRAAELHSLIYDDTVGLVLCAAGGDFLIDMLPYVDFELIRKHPKWIQGYSDPTNLLYAVTTVCDIATIYATNAGGFDMHSLHPSLRDNLAIWRGHIPVQHSFERYEGDKGADAAPGGGYMLTEAVCWKTPNGKVDVTGRMLGGCLDCLCDIIGTPYDGTRGFVERYRDDGIIWYFDIFAMRAETVHNTLWNMREAGWFDNARAFVFGRVLFGGTYLDMSYIDACKRLLGDAVPLVFDCDIGHVAPRMTVINGAYARLTAENGGGTLAQLAR